jgi:Gametolysin peptidase M11
MYKRREQRQNYVPPLQGAIIRDIRFCFLAFVVCLSQIAFVVSAIRQQTNSIGLLVKVSTADEEIDVNDDEFVSAVYSNSLYSVNKQLDACSSQRAPILVPYRSNETSVAEVLQVHLPDYSAAYNRTTIVFAAIDSVKHQLGLNENAGLGDFVDFVVFCVPTGLSGPAFLASGAYNSFWAVAKPAACTNPRILLHEFGHLLGLKHARQDGDEYGDETSVMGRTSNALNRCFNGYNFWKLKWFNDDYASEIITSSDSKLPVKLSLASFVDVSKLQSEQLQSVVVLKIDDYYLVYNRRKVTTTKPVNFPTW